MKFLSKLFIVLSLIFICALNAPIALANSPSAEKECAALKNEDFYKIFEAPTHITKAEFKPAKDGFPDYCNIEGYIAPQVGFIVQLPTKTWNQRFLMQGCGGFCGILFPSMCEDALKRGYATTVTDMGHKSSPIDGMWAYNDRQAEIDFAYRATHVVTVAAKEIINRFYGEPAKYNYFRGCSTGGRQGLVEAQQFPEDFDGIVVGAPPMNEVKSAVYALGWPMRVNRDKDGEPILTSDKLPLLHKAAIEACDMTDGIEDGIIGDPVNCRLDPKELQCRFGNGKDCLTKEQVRVANLIYGGARDEDGNKLMKDGPPPGSEMRWAGYLGEATSASGNLKRMHEDFLRYMAFAEDPGPDYDPDTFRFGADAAKLQFMERLYNAEHPDLRQYQKNGGKLLLYMGLQDSFSAKRLADYYQTVGRILNDQDALEDFFKIYLLPGVNHCRGGAGTDAVDWLTLMEAWVERGEAPDMITAYKLKSGKVQPSTTFPPPSSDTDLIRPIFPYPHRAMYKGEGDPNDTDNYERIIFEMETD